VAHPLRKNKDRNKIILILIFILNPPAYWRAFHAKAFPESTAEKNQNFPDCRLMLALYILIPINKMFASSFTFPCSACKKTLFLTDCLRLHEAIDDELGAGGILGYLVTTVEQILLAHLIRIIISKKPSLLGRILFVKDGPLAFFGQTANFHKPFRTLVSYLIKEQALNLVGLEKSGPFVDHAAEIAERLKRGSALILDNDYINP